MGSNYAYTSAMDGQFAVAGNRYADTDGQTNNGAVYVYQKRFGAWQYTQTLTASDAADNDNFGLAVSISGTQIVVGAYGNDDGGSNAGSAYIFEYNGTSWTQTAKTPHGQSIGQ